MRIYNKCEKKTLNNIVLYLTPEEAQEMKDSLEALLEDKNHHHSHVPDEEYKREVTISIYRKDNLSTFDEISKSIINNE